AALNLGERPVDERERLVRATVSNFRLCREYPYYWGDDLVITDIFQSRTRSVQLPAENASSPDIERAQRSSCSAAGAQVCRPVSVTSLSNRRALTLVNGTSRRRAPRTAAQP